MKASWVLPLSLLLLPALASAQVSDQGYVYAGSSFTWGITSGRTDYALYFRPDGTFCDDLGLPDWKTHVTGNYRKAGKSLILNYRNNSEEPDTLTWEDDPDVAYLYGAGMMRMWPPNDIPPRYYAFSSSFSSGGMGTGMVYVGGSTHEGYNFRADGSFTTDRSGGVVVSGDNVGGGSSSNSDGRGKYTIKDGLLTLTFDNGTVQKMSFFYHQTEDDNPMVVINGSIFFAEDEESDTPSSASGTEDRAQVPSSNNSPGSALSPWRSLLNRAREVHGGARIDNLKTVVATFTLMNMPFRASYDVDRQYMRVESLNPRFPYVEQLEGNTGWKYENKRTTPLPAERISELRASFSEGIFGLRSSVLDRANLINSQETEDEWTLLYLRSGETTSGYMIDEDGRMTASFRIKEGKNEITYNSDFRTVSGLLLPFREVTEADGTQLEVIYDKFEVNPVIGPETWRRP